MKVLMSNVAVLGMVNYNQDFAGKRSRQCLKLARMLR